MTTIYCPIQHCPFPVDNPLRMCKAHHRLVPKPMAEALSFYAKSHKYGPAHRASFERAVESVTKLIEGQNPKRQTSQPYRDD